MKTQSRIGLGIFLYVIFAFVADILSHTREMASWEMPFAIFLVLTALALIVSE